MMSFSTKLIMFDLDGTLIETASEIKDAVNDTLSHFQLQHVTQEQVNDWIGHGTHRLLIKALANIKNCEISEIESWNELKNISQVFNIHYQKRCGTSSQLYPHVKTVLKHLVLNNIRIAVVTNKESIYTHTILKQHQLDEVFDVVISGGEYLFDESWYRCESCKANFNIFEGAEHCCPVCKSTEIISLNKYYSS